MNDWEFIEPAVPSRSLITLMGGDVEDELPPTIPGPTSKKRLKLKKDFNFADETEARKFDKLKGLNENKLEEEIGKYAGPMDTYVVPDLEDFENEIGNWQLALPEEGCTDESELAHTYHRLNNYIIRLNQMLREAKAYQMIARTAYDHLMDVAQKVYPGTGPEKKGSAAYRLQAFFEAKNQAEFVVEVLFDWSRVLDKMHFRLRDGMEHLRSASRVNRSWNTYGESVAHERMTMPEPPDTRIRDRFEARNLTPRTNLEDRLRTRKM